MNRHSLGIILILTADQTLAGVITDGDIRRAVARQIPLHTLKVDQLMSTNPYHLPADTPAYDALNLMERHQITVLPIVEDNERVNGILHLHDILGKGEFKFNGK
jgi:arabinose-5-phosphate isomerase